MKTSRWLLVVVFCGVFVTSCFNPPEYPETPEIVFKSIDFIKGGKPIVLEGQPDVSSDTIVLKLSFKDGNGDIGIGEDDIQPPFNDRWYFLDDPAHTQDPGNVCDFSAPDNGGFKCWQYSTDNDDFYVRYSSRKTPGYYDSLLNFKTDFVDPFNCTNWVVVTRDTDPTDNVPAVPFDTVYFQLNPHYNNIFVEFQVVTGDPANPYIPFDPVAFFTYEKYNCGVRPFDGRIPVLSEDLASSTPLQGEIRYTIPSKSFGLIFGAQTLRLRVYIEDRARHKSNEIITREFNLTEGQ